MDNQSYTTTIEVINSPQEVFNGINNVAKWWVREAGGQLTEFEGQSTKLNDEFVLRHGEVHYSKHKVVELIPGKKIIWLVTDSRLNWLTANKQEWTGTKMVFEIFSRGEKTGLTFTHEGLVPTLECYKHCVDFWKMVIKDWLYNFITGSKT